MSTYISSFVIEPVLRQARRFSRPSRSSSEEVSHTAIAPLSYESHAVAPSDDESAIHEDATMDGIIAEGTRVQELPNPTLMGGATILEGSMVESPTREDDGLDLQLGGPERRSAPESVTSRQGISLSSSSVRSHPRRHSSMVDDDISGNPSFGVPNPFRSQRLGTTPSLPGTGVVHEGNEQSQEPASRRNTGPSQSSTNSRHHRARNGSLPADDGMAKMRQQIIQIQEMDISSLQKAQLMHDVMTEKYMTSNKWIGKNQPPRPHSPSSFHGHERPHTPTPGHPRSTLGGQAPLTPTSMSSHEGEDEGLYRLTVEDLKPTFIPDSTEASDSIDDQTNHVHSSDADSAEQASSLRFGCKHYKRNVKLQCSTCHGWYTCRFCHDEVENHTLIRKDTKHMLCMPCGCAQSAAAHCKDCNVRSAWYYCDVCKLWDDDTAKSIYHCNDCGLCRVGRGLGKDFFHCKTCGVCMSISVANSHRCIERSTECDCPICGDFMFTSPDAVVFMPCGHSIHQKCYYEHMKASYRCPICSRSVVNMEIQFHNMDRAIEHQPMPSQFRDTTALVYCNDCLAKSEVPYHWLGLKCGICNSYNTAQLQIISGSRTPTEALPEPHVNAPLLISGAADVADPSESSANVNGTRPRSDETLGVPGAIPVTGRGADEAEYDEEMDFWGGESPRERRERCVQSAESDESDKGFSDEEDDSDDLEDEMDVHSDEEWGEMDLIGHR